MDFNKLTEISVWDVRNVYNKVKNVVLNLSEMEIKVNEATGPEPWGASSTLMREIADATHNRKNFEDIMSAIYIKFNDTDPSSWRQVYKALQLIEYLVKNGSERVVDDVRGHITIIKMLKNFHHIDANGKDQGINVRHRSKELVELIQNKERLREERKKAKENRHKFENDDSSGGFSSAYGGYSGDGYAPSSSRFDDRSESASNYRSDSSSKRSTSAPLNSAGPSSRNTTAPRQKTAEPAKPAEPIVADLFSFDEEIDAPASPLANTSSAAILPAPSTAPNAAAPTAAKAADFGALMSPTNTTNFDDDWGDFQGSGASTNTKPTASNSANAMDLLGGMDTGLNTQPLSTSPIANKQPVTPTTATVQLTSTAKGSEKKAAFSDIWDVNSTLLSLDSLSLAKKSKANGSGSSGSAGQQLSMNQLANQKRGGF
ncbi:Epsin-3, clathrin recruitment and traffic between the Golgi and endosome [Coemansia sp. RSA 1358]|uniref:Epsin-3, clathrin recruitment and traffic between the Golgi and endosome n=1 Tax=Coemansia umbellata TaxID=1424467 RepID=A0ABQ8PPU5_9FUNG|nr:hypothetical protein BX070DRAFT_224329 [Coemansia spiralis]KAJ1993516.1 Epsin-3, clathrin recruitment and traffic between the Golgi and endosome [Coemansia umbellata]KAJ2625241.1 Epsin-3, clathrin recruitment and traffic between the Golgi and endosome [Coemansia sp. RSA 1358]